MSENLEVLQRLFKAVESRDLDTVLDCYDESIEVREAAALPYGGVYRGREGILAHASAWMEAWGSLQTADEAELDAAFFEGDDDTVCAVFRHRAHDSASGRRFDAPEVGVYKVRDGKVVRSQMFHEDSAAAARFLEEVGRS